MKFLERHSWLIPLVLLGAVGVGAVLVLARPPWLAPLGLWALFGLCATWLGVSVFWPAKTNRECPKCGEEALVRLDDQTTIGVRCEACGQVDREATSWFIAEEEGPLEEVVLRQRGRSLPTDSRTNS